MGYDVVGIHITSLIFTMSQSPQSTMLCEKGRAKSCIGEILWHFIFSVVQELHVLKLCFAGDALLCLTCGLSLMVRPRVCRMAILSLELGEIGSICHMDA